MYPFGTSRRERAARQLRSAVPRDYRPDELRARARELRDQAEQSDVKGVRNAALALAERYEEAAAARLGAR